MNINLQSVLSSYHLSSIPEHPGALTVPSPFNCSRLEALLVFLDLLHLLHFLFALLCLLRALGALQALTITLRISLHRRHIFLLLLALRCFFGALLALLARLGGKPPEGALHGARRQISQAQALARVPVRVYVLDGRLQVQAMV